MLCYAFSCSTTAVSYVAPAYIADRLCERRRACLRPWNQSAEMEPVLKMPEGERVDGKCQSVKQEAIDKAKADFVADIQGTDNVWGKWYYLEREEGDWLKPKEFRLVRMKRHVLDVSMRLVVMPLTLQRFFQDLTFSVVSLPYSLCSFFTAIDLVFSCTSKYINSI